MLWMVMYFLSDCYLFTFTLYEVPIFCLELYFGCLPWISTHTWVMAICAISIPKGRAHTCYTVHNTSLHIMDSFGFYIWITVGSMSRCMGQLQVCLIFVTCTAFLFIWFYFEHFGWLCDNVLFNVEHTPAYHKYTRGICKWLYQRTSWFIFIFLF
jgi:hypothetical protein